MLNYCASDGVFVEGWPIVGGRIFDEGLKDGILGQFEQAA